MKSTFTLTHNGTERSFEDWGLSTEPSFDFGSMVADSMSLRQPASKVADALRFGHGDTVQIHRDGSPFFLGRIVSRPRRETSRDSGVYEFRVAGPWWWMEHAPFTQPWYRSSNGSVFTQEQSSRVLLGHKVTSFGVWQSATLTEAATEIINRAIACGAPITLGALDIEQDIPIREEVDLSCSEALQICLRWTPDAVAQFDYSTATPTLNIRRRSGSTERSFSFGSSPLKSADLTPREDRNVPGVILKYEIKSTVNGAEFTEFQTDKYPLGASETEIGTFIKTIELAGYRVTTQRQKVETRTINESSLSWWQNFFPWLPNDAVVANGSKSPGDFSRELLEGAAPQWLDDDPPPIADEQITADITYEKTGPNGEKIKVTEQEFAITVKGTSLTTKTYERPTSTTAAEGVPSGLAQLFYEALNDLQQDGTLELVANAETHKLALGDLVNVSGSPYSEWETMKAQVQRLTFDAATETIRVAVGPAKHLRPTEFIELMRGLKGPPPTFRALERASGKPNEGNEVDGPLETANSTPSNAPSNFESITLANGDGDKIEIDPATGITMTRTDGTFIKLLWADLSTGDEVKLRSLDYCDEGTAKTFLAPATEPAV